MTHRVKRVAWALSAAAAVALGLGSLSVADPKPLSVAGQPVSAVIFPDEHQLPLRFSHWKHLEAGADCEDCHAAAAQSRSSLDNLIPTEAACEGCHAIDRTRPDKRAKPPAHCLACHPSYDPQTGFVPRVTIPNPNLKFSHKAHIDHNVACTTCHGDLEAEKVNLASRAQLPKMSLCLSCHDGRRAPDACTTCHLTEPGGTLRASFRSGQLVPSGSLRGADHDLTFRTNHKYAAQNDEEYCASCHRKSFCIECHSGVTKPLDFHGNDYVTLHTLDARRNSPDCSSCHRLQSFCVGCHSRSGVSPDGKGGAFRRPTDMPNSAGAFHPVGWGSGVGAGRHATEARRNIKQCASCHRESFCTTCHSTEVGGNHLLNINPHPRGWRRSTRCRALAERAGRMCLRCHLTAAEARCD